MSVKPVTEQHHDFCDQLDGSLPPDEFLNVLRQVDSQVFSGFGGHRNSGLLSGATISMLSRAAVAATRTTKGLRGKVIMTGCGTSGRLAFLTARRYNNRSSCSGSFAYCHAGGDAALLLSDELPEDDPECGRSDLMSVSKNGDEEGDGPQSVMVIGVTCGLSAPYVGGQVAPFLRPTESQPQQPTQPKVVSVALMGFNPAPLARNVSIPHLYRKGEAGTMREVALAFESKYTASNDCEGQQPPPPSFLLLNPVVGPEPIAGSSRMKGGTATLIMLDVICRIASEEEEGEEEEEEQSPPTWKMDKISSKVALYLSHFQYTHTEAYLAAQMGSCHAKNGVTLVKIMRAAAEAILHGGRVYYIGIQSSGCVGFIDLSEMPDTYGSPFDQMRGFVIGGWKTVGNQQGDLSHVSRLTQLSHEDFLRDIVPQLGVHDVVIGLVDLPSAPEEDVSTLKRVMEQLVTVRGSSLLKSSTATTTTSRGVPSFYMVTTVKSPSSYVDVKQLLTEGSWPCATTADEWLLCIPLTYHSAGTSDLALKLMLNAVSTYAQAAGRGALFKGYMIGTGPANDKIYQRCVELIAQHVHVSQEDAEIALIRSIYGIDSTEDAKQRRESTPRAQHIAVSILPVEERHMPQVVLPVAFLLAIPPTSKQPKGWTLRNAREAVAKQPLLAVLIREALLEQQNDDSHREKTIGSSKQEPLAVEAILGVDLGGTHIRAGLVTEKGTVHFASRATLDPVDRSSCAVVESLKAIVRDVLAKAEAASRSTEPNSNAIIKVSGLVVAQPGHVNLKDGSIDRLAAFESWGDERVPIVAPLQPLVGSSTPVYVMDDAESALRGELTFGACRLARTAVMLTVGTGVGSAVTFCNGTLVHRGARGLIELGHSIIPRPHGLPVEALRKCSCGQLGCVETMCSGTAIAAMLEHHLGATTTTSTAAAADIRNLPAQTQRAVAEALALCVLNAIRAYDPDVVVLGGSLGPILLPEVRKCVRELCWHLHKDAIDVPLSAAACSDAGVLGAAAYGWHHRALTSAPASSRFYLRRAELDDLPALYRVCLKTGDGGSDGTHLYSDPELLGSIYVGPYVTLSSAYAFALVDTTADDGVCGYVLGVLDTDAFQKRCRDEWRPLLRQKYRASRLHEFRPNEQALITDMILADDAMLDVPRCDWGRFPSHMHIDMLPHAQGNGLGVVMVQRLLDALRGGCSIGVHLGMAPTNHRAFQFYTRKLGFELYDDKGPEWILSKTL